MEDSFKCRVDETFGALFGPASDGGAQFWSVRESSMASDRAEAGPVREVESSGSDGDEDNGIRYENFLKLERSKRRGRRRHGEHLEAEVSGQEGLEELESEEEEDDEEEGRRHGKRNRRGQEQTAVESVSARNREMGEEEEEEEEEESVVRAVSLIDEDPEEEARQMRLLVGMDCTLDFEEEEDEYDKVAVGSEGTDDRLFMGQIRDFGTSLNLITPLPTSFDEVRQVRRDARANHEAALARLEEDDRQAANIVANESSKALVDTFEIGSELKERAAGNGDANVGGQSPPSKNEEDAMEIDGDGSRKEEAIPEDKNQTQDVVTAPLVPSCVRDGKKRKSGKRVRFAMAKDVGIACRVGISSTTESAVPCTSTMSIVPEVDQQSEGQMKIPLSNRYSRVPDHVRNPSKYIHYTIDWSEVDDEQQNMAAFCAFKGPTSVSNDTVSDKQEEAMVANAPGPVESAKISFNPLVSSRVVIGKDDVSKRGPKVLGMEVSGLIHQVGPVNIIANFETDVSQGEPKASEDDHDASIPSKRGTGAKIGRLPRRYRTKGYDSEDIEVG